MRRELESEEARPGPVVVVSREAASSGRGRRQPRRWKGGTGEAMAVGSRRRRRDQRSTEAHGGRREQQGSMRGHWSEVAGDCRRGSGRRRGAGTEQQGAVHGVSGRRRGRRSTGVGAPAARARRRRGGHGVKHRRRGGGPGRSTGDRPAGVKEERRPAAMGQAVEGGVRRARR